MAQSELVDMARCSSARSGSKSEYHCSLRPWGVYPRSAVPLERYVSVPLCVSRGPASVAQRRAGTAQSAESNGDP